MTRSKIGVRAALVVLLLACLALRADRIAAAEGTSVGEAKAVIAQVVALSGANDRRLADLYAEDAVLTDKRKYSDGTVGEVRISAQRYKAVIRGKAADPAAAGVAFKYDKCTYAEQGDRVAVGCDVSEGGAEKAHAESLLIGRDASGKWIIFEQHADRSR